MKIQIEIHQDDCSRFNDATFSINISEMNVSNREALKDLPDMVAQAYRDFFKLCTGVERIDGENVRTVTYRNLQDTL